MNKDTLLSMVERLSSCKDIQLSDIPSIDLYVDQVTTLFDDKLGDTKREPSEKVLTKTMINNYTKSKIIMPPKNKKYNKNHMILLSLIYNLKQILSINDIKLLFDPLFNKANDTKGHLKKNLDELYAAYLAIKEDDMKNCSDYFSNVLDHVLAISSEKNIGSNNDKDILMLLVLALTAQAAFNKRLAESIIDEYFSDKNN
ncbi:DUF1836 domain-containing protein [Lutispora thermophila]|uniref:DUF1836 domain-containing protein n=1 Tax=Lutispora thermophila DSM 19022 TaxID=1122184 RepID=A0A1M6B9S4_9FIRM|nr:DUF1836 domain-containing protein [Lutispora thermophila]SHI45462.1 protein of unknown function [Lutispora thermophila DSM 19022]